MDKDTWLPRVVGAFLVTMPYYPERSIRHDHEEGDMESRARLTPIVQANSARAAAWRVFFEASGRLQGILETRLKRTYGVSMPDYNILLALWEAPGHRLRMGELADRVVYSPSRRRESRVAKTLAIESISASVMPSRRYSLTVC